MSIRDFKPQYMTLEESRNTYQGALKQLEQAQMMHYLNFLSARDDTERKQHEDAFDDVTRRLEILTLQMEQDLGRFAGIVDGVEDVRQKKG